MIASSSRVCSGLCPITTRAPPRCFTPTTVSRHQHRPILCSASNGGNGDGKNTSQKPLPPFNVVITGSTKGLGLGLAKEFLDGGDSVVITSRSEEGVDETVSTLRKQYGEGQVKGISCDVTKSEDVGKLADFASDEFGRIDFWINNAGTNAYSYKVLSEFSTDEISQVLDTNLLGTLLGFQEALRIMKDQKSDGHIFNVEGAGSNGRPTPRMAAYGATKRAITFLTDTMTAELKMQDITNVGVHCLQPGICMTDLLKPGCSTADGKFFVNCLAEYPEVPSKFLVPMIRDIPDKSKPLFGMLGILPQNVAYLTPAKACSQIFRRLAFGERKDRFVPE